MNIKHVAENLYRSDRPRCTNDLVNLKHDYRIAAIVTLEEGWSDLMGWDQEKYLWQRLGRRFYHIPMSNFFPPTKDECEWVIKIVDEFDQFKDGNVLIHCYSGVDRTGIVSAYFLWKKCKMTPEEAWRYAVETGQHWWFRWWKKHFLEMCK